MIILFTTIYYEYIYTQIPAHLVPHVIRTIFPIRAYSCSVCECPWSTCNLWCLQSHKNLCFCDPKQQPVHIEVLGVAPLFLSISIPDFGGRKCSSYQKNSLQKEPLSPQTPTNDFHEGRQNEKRAPWELFLTLVIVSIGPQQSCSTTTSKQIEITSLVLVHMANNHTYFTQSNK